jgi:dipeptidyl aminopeptidase/acylaminoacyl peptidase
VRNELRAKIYVVPEGDATRATAITSGAGTDDGVEGLAWTPDDRLVYTSSAGGNTDIWIMDTDGLNRSQLTTAPGADEWPRVTPDGKVVVFTSERDGGRALWRMDIDGGRQQRLVPANVRVRPMLSSDGKEIYYGDEKARQNFRVSIDGGTPTPLPDLLASGGPGITLPEGFHEPAPSPDGRLFAGHYFARDQRGERMVVITPGRADGVAPAADGASPRAVVARQQEPVVHRHASRHLEPVAASSGRRHSHAGHKVHQRPDLPVCPVAKAGPLGHRERRRQPRRRAGLRTKVAQAFRPANLRRAHSKVLATDNASCSSIGPVST